MHTWRKSRWLKKMAVDWTQEMDAIVRDIEHLKSYALSEDDYLYLFEKNSDTTSKHLDCSEEYLILGRSLLKEQVPHHELRGEAEQFKDGHALSASLILLLRQQKKISWETVLKENNGHLFLSMYRIFSTDETSSNPLLNLYFMENKDISPLLRSSGVYDCYTYMRMAAARGNTFHPSILQERELYYEIEENDNGFHGGTISNPDDYLRACHNLYTLLNVTASSWHRHSIVDYPISPILKEMACDKLSRMTETLKRHPEWYGGVKHVINDILDMLLNAASDWTSPSLSDVEQVFMPLRDVMTGADYAQCDKLYPELCQSLLGESYTLFCNGREIYELDDVRPWLLVTTMQESTHLHW